jgi:hypothetical protein
MRIHIRKFGLIASIICFAFTSTIGNAFAGVGSADPNQELHQTNKLNQILPQLLENVAQGNEREKYRSAYENINSITFDFINCKNLKVQLKVSSQTSTYNSLCVRRGGGKIGKMEAPAGRLSTLVYWVNKKPEIIADLTDSDRSVVWFFSEGKLVAQLNSIGSEETLQTNFTSEQYKEATDRAFVLSANFSQKLD